MGRKTNYGGYTVSLHVKTRADAIKLTQSMVETGFLPRDIGLRESDALDNKDRKQLLVKRTTDPGQWLWSAEDGVIDTDALTKGDLKTLLDDKDPHDLVGVVQR